MQAQARLLGQQLVQRQVAGLQRITLSGWQGRAAILLGIDATAGLPGQVARLAHPGRTEQGATQGLALRRQGQLLAQAGQPALQGQGSKIMLCSHANTI